MIYWALSFLSLGAALVLLSIFSNLIENDLEWHSLGREAAIAGVASFIEAISIWLLVVVIPAQYRPVAVRTLFIPALVVALIYKITHLEDWSRYEVLFLLMFQVFVGAFGASLVMGHFLTAASVLVIFAAVMAAVIGFARSL